MKRPKVFFYVQHLLGVGHLVRASRIAVAMVARGFEVKVVWGGKPVDGFPPQGTDSLALPALSTSDIHFTTLVRSDGTPATEEFLAARRDILLSAFREYVPDVVLLEAFPFGRRPMHFELLPLLEALSCLRVKPIVLTSVRDILEPLSIEREQRTIALINDHFDAVLVHGDPAFTEFGETFKLVDQLSEKIFYTGLVAPFRPTPSSERFNIVVSAGGGASAAFLIRLCLGAAKELSSNLSWCVVAGPYLPDPDYHQFQSILPTNVHLRRFLGDFSSVLSAADLSVSRAGYNTICDLLTIDCRSIVVPYEGGGAREQLERAKRLHELNYAVMLREKSATPQLLASIIMEQLGSPRRRSPNLNFSGAETTADMVRTVLR